MKKAIFELTDEEKRQLLMCYEHLGYATQKAWLLAKIAADVESLKRTTEGEKAIV